MRATTFPVDEIFALKTLFEEDSRKSKVNGGIGTYLDEQGRPFVLPVAKKVFRELEIQNFNYLPISGEPNYLDETGKLALGNKFFHENHDKIVQQGTMGGTNGIFLWSQFIKTQLPKPTIIIGNPTWENHEQIFRFHGFHIVYFDHLKENRFNIEGLIDVLQKHPRAFLLLHAGPTHNPTGINATHGDLLRIAQIVKKQANCVLFDFAYLGLGDSIDEDCFGVRTFCSLGIPTSIVVSYSKNMSLYQHRTGALLMLCKIKKEKITAENTFRYLFRITNSNPAAVGELLVAKILSNKKLCAEWEGTLGEMIQSLAKRRKLFAQAFGDKKLSEYLDRCRGLFSLLPLTKMQIITLREKHAIYLLENGRINFGGLSIAAIPKVARIIQKVLRPA